MTQEIVSTVNKDIKDKGLELADILKELGELGYEKQKLESKAYLEVSEELLETGKPKYSNEKLRDCAMVLKLAEDKEYQDLDNKFAELKHKSNVLGVEKAYFENHLEILMNTENAP